MKIQFNHNIVYNYCDILKALLTLIYLNILNIYIYIYIRKKNKIYDLKIIIEKKYFFNTE